MTTSNQFAAAKAGAPFDFALIGPDARYYAKGVPSGSVWVDLKLAILAAKKGRGNWDAVDRILETHGITLTMDVPCREVEPADLMGTPS